MGKSNVEQIDVDTFEVTDFEKRITAYGEKLVELKRIVKNPIDIWLIGNTGMRNPWRIPSGFKVYAESNMVGRIRTPEDQVAFKMILLNSGEIGGDLEKDVDASITRKYRLMFNKYGFAYPEVRKNDGFTQEELGPIDGITPLGRVFYSAVSVSAQQECFLRGLIVPMHILDNSRCFSPLLWVLSVLLRLEERVGDSKISFIEFATCVQTSTPLLNIDEVIDEILRIRENRKLAENKKRFDSELIDEKSKKYLLQKANFKTYADMNIRHLISSGILKRSGRGISLITENKTLAKELIKGTVSDEPLKERLIRLCNGAELPTDNVETANMVLNDLLAELNQYNISYEMPNIPLDSAKNINIVRASLKRNIDNYKEEEYAKLQALQWKEIYEYMQLLIVNNGHEKELDDENYIKVPTSEAAAYLEWTLWRAFLAIDHTINKPYDARSFRIDQDYLPVGTAPGGGPDMVFEFEDYVIVVEVTMSTNSRQEAMEGEPVRRHVADLVMKYNKPVYGVFVANKIDSNTAETFRIGVWYNKEDEKMALRIVPFTLKQFSFWFKKMFESGNVSPDYFLGLFRECFIAKENKEAPQWKLEIDKLVNHGTNDNVLIEYYKKFKDFGFNG